MRGVRTMMVALAFVLFSSTARADDWPGWLGPQRDGVWREQGLLETFPPKGPKVLWRTPIGEGYAGPAVAAGKVFITDRVRPTGSENPDNPFDRESRVEGKERILCLDEAKGTVLWKHEYDCTYQISYASGPRCTPVVDGDKVYALGAMGDLVCVDIPTGKPVWHKKLLEEYKFPVPGWGFAGHPLIEGDKLICLVGGKGSVAVAFNKNDGTEIWKNLTAVEPGYAPPMIYEFGGKRQLILWHPQSVNSLNIETGEVYWSVPWGGQGKKGSLKAGMSIPTPRKAGDHLFLTCFYDGSLMLKVDGTKKADVVWRSESEGERPKETDKLHCVMSTPYLRDGHIYGVCSYGEMRCLKAEDGKRLWDTHKYAAGKSERWGNAFLVPQGERTILFNELGDLIIAKFTAEGHKEISRANILTPTNAMAPPPGRRVIWSHPAFANRNVYARSDREIICVSMAKE